MSYYLLHRGWLDHELFGEDEPFCRRAAWAWLIEHAAYTARQVRIAGKLVTLQRGQLTFSLRYLARAWGWGHERVRRFLRDLAERDMIETANVTGGETPQTVITICNYERYQAPDHAPRDSVRDSRQAKSETNIKEERKEDSLSPNGERSAEGALPSPDPHDPIKAIYARGVAMLGRNGRRLLAKLIAQHGDVAVLNAISATEKADPIEPAGYLIACLSRAAPTMGAYNYRTSPRAAIFEGGHLAAQSYIARHFANRGTDSPAAEPLLDGQRTGPGAESSD